MQLYIQFPIFFSWNCKKNENFKLTFESETKKLNALITQSSTLSLSPNGNVNVDVNVNTLVQNMKVCTSACTCAYTCAYTCTYSLTWVHFLLVLPNKRRMPPSLNPVNYSHHSRFYFQRSSLLPSVVLFSMNLGEEMKFSDTVQKQISLSFPWSLVCCLSFMGDLVRTYHRRFRLLSFSAYWAISLVLALICALNFTPKSNFKWMQKKHETRNRAKKGKERNVRK